MVGSEPCSPVGLAISCDNGEAVGAVIPATGEVMVVSSLLEPARGDTDASLTRREVFEFMECRRRTFVRRYVYSILATNCEPL
jgi:hypothetical protein